VIKQSRLFDYPSEVVERSPGVKVILPPRRHEERIITYTPKHRKVPQVVEVSEEQAKIYKEMRRRGIEYHQMRSKR